MTSKIWRWAKKHVELVKALVRHRELAAGPGARVPAAIADCLATARWLIEHAQYEFGTSWLSIGGESASAHLSGAAGGSESDYVELVESLHR